MILVNPRGTQRQQQALFFPVSCGGFGDILAALAGTVAHLHTTVIYRNGGNIIID